MKDIKLRLAKSALWLLILAITVWTIDRDPWLAEALAGVTLIPTATRTETFTANNGYVATRTVVLYRTQTYTSTTTGTGSEGPHTSTNSGSSTDTNCHTGGGQYGGGQWNWCNRTDPTQQKNSQNDNKDLNNNGADQSTALGMAAIAAGMAMVAAGMALLPNPPTTPIGVALIAAGMALIAAGMAALAAAGKMNNNANKSNGNAQNLDNLTDKFKSTISSEKGKDTSGSSSLGDGGNTNLGDGNQGGIKIDPALMRSGKMDAIYGDMEKKTGLNRDEFAKAMANGANPLNLLSNSPAMAGKPSASEGNLQKMMDDTLAKGNLPSGQEVMDKLGLERSDLGGGGVREVAAGGTPNIDALFPGSTPPSSGSDAGSSNGLKVSSDVQAALDRGGITGRSLFEMVHSQYVKKTPHMFGVQQQKDGTASNPYTGIGAEKVDL